MPFAVYLTTAYVVTGGMVWVGVGMVGEEAAQQGLLSLLRDTIGWQWGAEQVEGLDPRVGRLAVVVAINEMLEIVRLPFVIATFPALRRAILRRRAGGGT